MSSLLPSKKNAAKWGRRGAFLTAHGRDGSWQRRKERLTADALIDREVVLQEVGDRCLFLESDTKGA